MSEPEPERSLTPCLDENQENGNDDDEQNIENAKSFNASSEIDQLEDIISDDEQWPENECNKSDEERNSKTNGGNKSLKSGTTKNSSFKKITKNTRERNYRDNIKKKPFQNNQQQRSSQYHRSNYDGQSYRRGFETKRKEIERYSVRNVIANREFSISKSRSRTPSPIPPTRRGRKSNSRKRSFSPPPPVRRRSNSPFYSSSRYRSSPISNRKHSPPHSRSPSLDRYHNKYRRQSRSLSPGKEITKRASRSRSRHKNEKTLISLKIRVPEKTGKKKKIKPKEQRKHKKSRSKSKQPRSTSKISSRSLSPIISRSLSPKSRQIVNLNFQSTLGLGGTSSNLLGTISSRPQENIKVILKNDDAIIKKNRTKKRDKKSRKGGISEEVVSRKKVRRNSVKEVKKPPKFVDKFGKENNKSADVASKEVFASGDNILVSVSFNNKSKAPEKSRKHKKRKAKSRKEVHSKGSVPLPMLPLVISKRKTGEHMKPIAIIDLDKSPGKELTQSPKDVIVLSDSDGENKQSKNSSKDVIIIEHNAPDPPTLYDPFEPTKSGSASPATPPPNLHNLNDVSSSSDMLLSKNFDHESPLKSYTPIEHHNTTPKEVNNVQPLNSIEEHQISTSSVSIWNIRDLDKKAPSTSPLFNLFGAVNVLSKPSLLYSMEDALYGSDLKSTVAEPKQSQATVNFLAKVGEDNNNKLQQQQQLLDDDNDLKSPYSPSSDGYNDFEAPPPSTSLAPLHSISKNSQFDSAKHQHQSMDLDSTDEERLMDDVPNSAVDLLVQDKLIKKLNRQERVAEEVKHVLKPHYNKKHITKDEYKDILRRAVPKICHNRTGEINIQKISMLVEAYVKKMRHKRKSTTGSH
ncbi:unnamed protein product [Diamesa serratosioi]